jgi:hypothetical protein
MAALSERGSDLRLKLRVEGVGKPLGIGQVLSPRLGFS